MRKLKILFCLVLLMVVVNLNIKVKAAEQLPDNGAKISSAVILQTKSGTGPWDDDNGVGNDTDADNDIIRSFDQITWTIENTFVLNDGVNADSFSGGKIYFEAKLPNVLNKETAMWDLYSMGWIENPTVSSDGLTLTGYYQMSTDNITIPGKQTLIFVAKVLGEKNGTKFTPTFSIWLNGNSNENHVNLTSKEFTVSAAPNFNVRLIRNNNLSKRAVDLNDNGNLVTGRVYGYAFLLQLYNKDNPSKGLRGIEYPQGDITFDIDMTLKRSPLGSSVQTDITDDALPILWNYKVNGGAEILNNRSMSLFSGGNQNARWFAPYGTGATDRLKTTFKSGNIEMIQEGRVLHVTVENYGFDGSFPRYNNEYVKNTAYHYGENIGTFSVGYFQVIVPDTEASTVNNSNYGFAINDYNFHATSISGQEVNTQVVTSDDVQSLTHVQYAPGSFTQRIYFFYDTTNTYLHSSYNSGDGYAANGQYFRLKSGVGIGSNNDPDDYIYSVDRLIKFDGDCFEPVKYDDGSEFKLEAMNNMKFHIWYATKEDGTNWSSQAEMNNGKVQDLVYYENYEDIPEGHKCIGVYFESYEGYLTPLQDNGLFVVRMIVKDTAEIGKVYAATMCSKYYRTELDRTVYSQLVQKGYEEYPATAYSAENLNYIKSEYNAEGSVVSGTHNGGYVYGQSLLIVGGIQSISQKAIDEDGVEKVNYDISKNQNVVKYQISPRINNAVANPVRITGVTVKLTDTLPEGLTYIPGSSNYGEPEITNNSDGSTTLVWNILDCTVGETIQPLVFSASISEESANGKQYENVVVMEADEKVGNTNKKSRTSEYDIQIINLASHRLYKTDSTPVIEKDGQIHFVVSYKNNTDEEINNFQLLDILPYNGDGRGTDYTGSYIVEKVVLSRTDSSGNEINDDSLKVYYSTDESARNVNSKDDNLAEGWNEVTTENLMRNLTAIVVKGHVQGQERINLDIYVKTSDNKGLDKYVNNATAQVYVETEEMLTSNVTSQVVLRTIEGIAWKDANANGIKDANEEVYKDVAVTLTDASGAQVTDVDGHAVTTINTDDNGYYKFTNLPMGNYLVKVAVADNTYMLTEKEVGSNTTINSKFNVETATTDEITKLNSIDLPELTQSNVNAGFVKKPTKVVVNYIEKGTTTKLLPEYTINGRIDDEYGTTNRIAEVNAANENKYNYDSVDGEVSGFMVEDTIYITYYYVKKDTQVKVLHVEEGTDVSDPEAVTNVLYATESLTGKVDDEYSTNNKLNEINLSHTEQYDFVRSTTNTSGTMKVDTVYVIYEYKKVPATVKVQHLEKGTNAVLNPEETLNGIVGLGYETSDKLTEINATFGDKYELVTPEPSNKNGTYAREEQTVTYYYQKKESRVVIIHVDSETVITDPETVTDVLYPTEEKTGRVDDLYNSVERTGEINATSNYKYALDHIIGSANGNFAVDTIYVIYVYAKQDTVLYIKHVDVITGLYIKHVDVITGEELDSITVEGYIGDIVNTREGTFPSYRLYEKPATEEYVLAEDPITVTYYYIRQANVITKYIDEVTGNEISTQNFDTYDQNSEYGTVKKDIPEYTYTRDTGNTTGTIGIDDVFVTYYYKKNTSLLVRYIDYYTEEEISPSITMNGIEGQDYETEQKEIDNYVYVDVIGTPEGQMAREPQEIIYRYKKQANLITEHIDANTGEKIVPDVIKKYMEKEEYEAYGQNIPGYVLVQEPESKTGVMGREDVTKTFYYKKISGGLIVKYVDVLTGELLDQEVYEGTEGEHIDFDKKHFLYYVLHSTPEVESANLTVEPQEYIYYYIRLGKVPVKGIVQGTGEELYTYELSGIEGDQYQATPRNVEGYELVVIPDNERGTYQRNTREVVYEYRKIEEEKHGDVIVKYITEDGEELARETDNGLVGETFHFEEKTFEGYEVISRPDSLDGEYIEGTIELVFVLRPVEPEIVEGTIIVKFVDKNGNVLRQQVVSKDLVGEDYYLEAPEIDGYHVVGEDKVRATYVDGELVFEIVYDKDEEIPADPDSI